MEKAFGHQRVRMRRMNNETLKCKDCGITFESSTELELKTKSCPKCIEKSQDEMMRIMFGEPNERKDDER